MSGETHILKLFYCSLQCSDCGHNEYYYLFMNIIIKLEKRNGTFDGHNRCSKGFNDCCKEILVPKGVPLLALTATATITLRKEICAILGMKKPTIIAIFPCKENIMYAMSEFSDIAETFAPLLNRLQIEGHLCHTLVFIVSILKNVQD